MVLAMTPNAAPQPRPEAAAQRRLEGVGCRRLFGMALTSCEPASGVPLVLLDHLICQEQQGWGHRDPQRLSGLEVDDQLEFHWLLHGQVSRFGTL